MEDIATERQRQAAILTRQPGAEVYADLNTLFLVGELAFVSDQANFSLAGCYGVKNSVEGYDHIIQVTSGCLQPQLQGEERAGHGARDGDFRARDFMAGEFLFGDEHWAVAIAHAGTAGEKGIFVGDVRVRMDADG